MCPLINFLDKDAHKPDGSSIWWAKRIDSDGAPVNLGLVTGCKVTNPGSGYTTTPTIVFTGGGGTGAAGTALLYNEQLAGVLMTNYGDGAYTSAPAMTVTGGSGSGAALTSYWSDGYHLMPGRMSVDFEAGQEETPVADEGSKLFTYKKEVSKGEITIQHLQHDVYTKNFFAKEAADYYWRVFQHVGVSRGEIWNNYRLIAIVRFPKHIKDVKPNETMEVKGIVLENESAITITEADLPVANLVKAYDVAAGGIYTEDEELALTGV